MDPTASDVVINLIHTGNLLVDELAARLRPYGITPTGFRILAILRIAEMPQRPTQIAELLRITTGTVTGLLDSLEKADLVRRRADPADRRTIRIELTDKAHDLQRDIFPVQFRAETDICADLAEQQRETLIELLAALQTSLLELSSQRRR